ncbi:MAG: HAD-IIIC family phosphatase [Lachnospiraceae bacterium]|jgi:FkbH-like protein|nr:HAD-IIIC family phosphatase [Lachnospiraceae bacterium]
MKFAELEKNCKKSTDTCTDFYSLAILGNCATQHLAKAIKGYAYEEKIALHVFDADYNQIDAQVMDNNSELYQMTPDFTLFWLCTEKLYEAFCQSTNRSDFANQIIMYLEGYWNRVNQQYKTTILQFNFTQIDDRIFGNYGNKTQDSFLFQIRKLNYLLMEKCTQYKNVFIIDIEYLQQIYGEDGIKENKMYYIAKMPLSTKILPEVAKQTIDVIKAMKGKMKKCVILDLDNTLWGGVIGDDGLENIQIGELGLGHAFSEFQMWLKELQKRGIILAVCSKNEEVVAKEPFLHHPEMVLHMEDIAMFVANWEDKASNIKKIQDTLNIGMDSIVFFDDNPFERNLVKSMIPDITVPDLPEDPSQYLEYVKLLNLFETAAYSETDKNRTKQYQEEIGRVNLQKQFSSYSEYLESLEMVAEAKPFDKFHFSRIAQLTQRSNQFNLRTVRYTEQEIEQLAKEKEHLTLYFTLKDKFGDYGLISVVVLDKQPENTLFISEWLMSCRVLKRGMEEFILDEIIRTAEENGFKKVIGEYIRTPKNNMVSELYKKMGFHEVEKDRYEVNVTEYEKHKTYIQKQEKKS